MYQHRDTESPIPRLLTPHYTSRATTGSTEKSFPADWAVGVRKKPITKIRVDLDSFYLNHGSTYQN